MCGRTACALGPDVICRACSYKDPKTGQHQTPEWKDHPQSPGKDQQYYPSANVPPTRFTPVLFKNRKSGKYVVQPMMWGMIPPWHEGEPTKHGMSSNNCRLEGLKETKLYKNSLNNRRVCVVLAQGFYEWNSFVAPDKGSVKQPYFIYMPQGQEDFKVKIADDSVWNNSEWNETEGWKGPKMLMMAGLYDVWTSPENEHVYSYTIITMESNETLFWLHHRMPAILETPEEVDAWLNVTAETSITDMIGLLKPATNLEWYKVSTKVNNARCRDMDCSKPEEIKENKSKSLMANWLKKGQPATIQPKSEVPEKENKSKSLMANWLKKGQAATTQAKSAVPDKKAKLEEEEDKK